MAVAVNSETADLFVAESDNLLGDGADSFACGQLTEDILEGGPAQESPNIPLSDVEDVVCIRYDGALPEVVASWSDPAIGLRATAAVGEAPRRLEGGREDPVGAEACSRWSTPAEVKDTVTDEMIGNWPKLAFITHGCVWAQCRELR